MQQVFQSTAPALASFESAPARPIDFVSTAAGICFRDFWIPEQARFRQCFLPVIAGIPAILAALILLFQLLRLLVPYRPRWTKPFVEEIAESPVDDTIIPQRRWTGLTKGLAMLTALGTCLQFAASLVCVRTAAGFLPVLPWLVALLEVLVYRPRTVTYSVLTILVIEVIAEAILLDHGWSSTTVSRVLSICSIAIAALTLVFLSCMPYRDPLLPSKDISKPVTAPTSTLRSPEESLNIWQFMTVTWMSPLMKVGNSRQLEDDDVWTLHYEFLHRRLHENFRLLKGTVLSRLLQANGIDLVIVTVLGLTAQVCWYGSPVFLQLILSSMQDPDRPKTVALKYAAMGLCTRLLAAQISVFNLWYGRRCYERSRGEMIMMLYEKTLGRKIAFQEQEKKKDDIEKTQKNGQTNGQANGTHAKKQEGWLAKSYQKLQHLLSRTKVEPPPKEPAVMGKILNLMRNDVYEVAQRFWEFDDIFKKPASIILTISLVVNYLGAPALMALGLLAAAQVINAILARLMMRIERKRRLATDAKLQIISQFVEAIRHLRWYGWQDTWLSKVLSARQLELNWRVVAAILNVIVTGINTISLELAPVVAFASYTIIMKERLTVDIAFPALQLLFMMSYQMMELPNLVTALINAWVALGRIEDYMAEADREEMATEALIGDKLALDDASFAWPGTSVPTLKGVKVSFPEGLTVVCGEVGSGKTALLQALLGEMDMLDGQLIRPPDPVGYCTQSPWLQSMSIRDNILFSAPYEDQRYRAVLDACALTPDLAEFKSGDLSMIGENGIGLSGGQRARVALARAVYSKTNILLLDDPLAALDQQTAELIVKSCLAGPLLKGRTAVLVTHRTDLVLGFAEQVVKIESGVASVLDHDAPELSKDTQEAQKPADEGMTEGQPSEQKAVAVPEKFIEDEHRAYGGVQARVYWQYIKAGSLWYWAICILILIGFRICNIAEAWFVKRWGESSATESHTPLHLLSDDTLHTNSWDPLDFLNLPPPEINIRPWIICFAIVATLQGTFVTLSRAILQVIVYTAAKTMFRDIMEKVAHATFRFYDVTPVGRLMNRMTSDIGVIDGGISTQFQIISWLALAWLSSVIIIASIAPAFLVFTILLTATFYLIFRRFIPTSQNLRRLEMVSLTPLMSNFGELLNGLSTVRAFRAQTRFQDRVISVVDTFQKMDHFYWSLQAWLTYRYDVLAGFATFLLFVLALATDLSPGLTAFTLSAANRFVVATHDLCKQYGQLQMEFVSVERVVELLQLEQEPEGDVSPPAWWPSFSGDIVFKGVTIKYAPHLDPALSSITFTVKGGSKTAIIGRTGSGKSTLALAMLATILPADGQICIDNIDLAEVDKQLLRTRITFLAQDPVLFPGTMRQNLDPVDEHSDEDCELVLRRVCERQGWQLDTNVEAGGKNLSQGQRQLVGLARAVLRRSAIIILDEATASIDRETAMQIQQVMHEEMKESTVITIAHRLEAVRNADYCIVLGKGKIIEQGPASEMLKEHRDEMVDNVEEDE